jgi:hypothetical protein
VTARWELARERILAFRRRVGALDGRLPWDEASLRRAAWAGLQDSMPRAALLSLHARIVGTGPDALDDPSLVQLWGPRFSVYVVPARDRGIFTLGRLSDDVARRRRAEELAADLRRVLDGRTMREGDAGRALGVHPSQLRYAAPTGTVVIRWDGARQPTLRSVPPPDIEPTEARRELARRYLHVFGPATPAGLGAWAGIRAPAATAAFETLAGSTTPVRTPLGDAWILSSDEEGFRADGTPDAPARLLPSGDAYTLRWGADRDLLVPVPAQRDELWTARVWPGAVLVAGEIVGTWRRARHEVRVRHWRPLSSAEQEAIEAEAVAFPLPGLDRPISVAWSEAR